MLLFRQSRYWEGQLYYNSEGPSIIIYLLKVEFEVENKYYGSGCPELYYKPLSPMGRL